MILRRVVRGSRSQSNVVTSWPCSPAFRGGCLILVEAVFHSDEPRRNRRASVIVYGSMAPWAWIVIAAGVVLAIWLLVVVIGTPARRRKAKRKQAERLRREAEETSHRPRAVRSRHSRRQLQRNVNARPQQAIAQADALDPDLPDSRSHADHDAVGERPAGTP
jgi:hypothetical protein